MSLAAGTRLGPYEIISPLGAGGMGEVYRARDRKLNRDVALKVLPEQFALDADRLARFRREAQVLASLNHPNIGGIYGLEDAGGIHALVLELVEGPTLADRIAKGPMPLDEALPIARQIAEALEAAHERGIIHRDLKPANIKLRSDGTVKVLDFGLAKALEPAHSPSDVSQSPTITSPALMTGAGVILGTAAYMSPEQAKGRAADKRSDIWAFGCVLHEMLTGKRAFGGDDVSETLAFILTKDPEWITLPANTLGSIRKLLRRCLEKDRTRRLADVADARLEIDEALTAPDAELPRVPGASRGRQERIAWSAAGMLAVLLVIALIPAILYIRRAAPEPLPTRFEIQTPPTSIPTSFALSPDGRQLAFVATAEGAPRLWVRPLDRVNLVRPPDYREWTFLGSGLGLTYDRETAPPTPNFTNVFVNPASYRAFMQTEAWLNGTIFVLEVRRSQTDAAPNKGGRFQTDFLVLEAEVKDSRFPDGWAFFNFGRGTALTDVAAPLSGEAAASCVECHTKHTAVERTWRLRADGAR